MQEHEPWEIGETRKKNEQLKGPSGMNGAETRAEFNSQWGYKSPLPRRDSSSTTTRVFVHSSHSSSYRLTVYRTVSSPHYRLTVLFPHRLTAYRHCLPNRFLTVFPHRKSPNLTVYRPSSPIPSTLTVTKFATRLAHRDSSVLPLSSVIVLSF